MAVINWKMTLKNGQWKVPESDRCMGAINKLQEGVCKVMNVKQFIARVLEGKTNKQKTLSAKLKQQLEIRVKWQASPPEAD